MPVLDVEVEVEIPAVPEVKELTVADVLYGAAELLSKPGGWIKGRGTNYEGAYCAAGAIITSIDPPFYKRNEVFRKVANVSLYNQAMLLAGRVLGRTDPVAIVKYNDNPWTKQEDIVDVLRKAGDLAVQEGL